MNAWLLSVLRNLVIGIAMLALSSLLIKQKETDPPKPAKNDYSPTADEGTEIKQLFGTGPVEMIVVAVFDRATDAIRV